MRLDLNLPAQLMLNVVFHQLRLEHHFEGNYVFTFLLAGQIHIAELAFAQRPTDLEVIERPPFDTFLAEELLD